MVALASTIGAMRLGFSIDVIAPCGTELACGRLCDRVR
jgi:hypothetical protein